MSLPSAPPRPAAPPARRRLAGVADMFRSMGVVVAFTALVLIVGAGRVLLFPGHQPGPPPVDFVPQVRLASSSADLAFLAPAAAPRGWRAVSADVSASDPVHLHVGFRAAGGAFVALEEEVTPTGAASRAFLAAELESRSLPRSRGTEVVRGITWTIRRDARGEVSLSTYRNGLTVLLVSTAGSGPLRTFAGALG